MRYVALDTETHLIADRPALARPSGQVFTGPWVTPRLVCGSEWGSNSLSDTAAGSGGVFTADSFCARVAALLANPSAHLVFHNAPFDLDVLWTYDPSLREPLLAAVDAGRIHDTKVLDVLVRLARGEFDLPRYDPATKKWATPLLKERSLDALALDWCGIHLSKDPAIRLTFAQYDGKPLEDYSPAHRAYAAQDAVATYRVWQALLRAVEVGGWKNLLTEATQVRAAILCHELDKVGVAVDRAAAEKLAARFEADVIPLQTQLVAAGLGRWEPHGKPARRRLEWNNAAETMSEWYPDGKWYYDGGEVRRIRLFKKHGVLFTAPAEFHLDTRTVQSRLEALDTGGEVPERADGSVSLDADFWSVHVPREDADLRAWLTHEKLRKILTTYLDLYSAVDEVYPRWHALGARSGRMSASRPSVQNVSKRRYGIRSVFVPRPGCVFVRADYSSQELYTLAEVMLSMGIDGRLAAVLRSGCADVHRRAASFTLGKPEADVSKAERQGQKVVSFGVPGGLGAAKLAKYAWDQFGVAWTKEEAAAARYAFLNAFPDVDEYLSRIKVGQDACLRAASGRGLRSWRYELDVDGWNVVAALLASDNPRLREVGEAADRYATVVLPTGRARSRCRFTEAANTYFQGLASDVTKEAAWRAFRAGLRVVLVVHDEIVVEVAPDRSVPVAKCLLERAMLGAFADVCPNFGKFARVELTECRSWGPATDAAGKEIV